MGQCSDEEDLEASVLLRSMARSVFWFFTFQETGAAVDRAALAREASFKFFRCFCDGHLSWQDIDGEPLEDDDEPAEARLCSDSYGNLYHTKLFLFSGSPQGLQAQCLVDKRTALMRFAASVCASTCRSRPRRTWPLNDQAELKRTTHGGAKLPGLIVRTAVCNFEKSLYSFRRQSRRPRSVSGLR